MNSDDNLPKKENINPLTSQNAIELSNLERGEHNKQTAVDTGNTIDHFYVDNLHDVDCPHHTDISQNVCKNMIDIHASSSSSQNTDETDSNTVSVQTDPSITVFALDRKGKKIMVEIVHYYTHFLMFVIFEMLFYFHYIVPYEKKLMYQMIKEEEENVIKFLNIDITQYYNSDYYDRICTNLVDNRTDKNNAQIYDNALYMIFGLLIILLVLIMIETSMFTQKSTFPKELVKSIFLMIFIGLFDFVFFNFFILKYKVIDTAELMCYLYENTDN